MNVRAETCLLEARLFRKRHKTHDHLHSVYDNKGKTIWISNTIFVALSNKLFEGTVSIGGAFLEGGVGLRLLVGVNCVNHQLMIQKGFSEALTRSEKEGYKLAAVLSFVVLEQFLFGAGFCTADLARGAIRLHNMVDEFLVGFVFCAASAALECFFLQSNFCLLV